MPHTPVARPVAIAVILLALAHLPLTACAPAGDSRDPDAPAQDTEADAEAVLEVLDLQVEAWNRSDIEGFMAGYLHSETLRFASGGQVRQGWQTTLQRYLETYPDQAAMGTLSFDELDIRLVGPDTALVFGRWRLERAEDEPNGLFTLVLERRAEGWRIVHDHTSSAPAEAD